MLTYPILPLIPSLIHPIVIFHLLFCIYHLPVKALILPMIIHSLHLYYLMMLWLLLLTITTILMIYSLISLPPVGNPCCIPHLIYSCPLLCPVPLPLIPFPLPLPFYLYLPALLLLFD